MNRLYKTASFSSAQLFNMSDFLIPILGFSLGLLVALNPVLIHSKYFPQSIQGSTLRVADTSNQVISPLAE